MKPRYQIIRRLSGRIAMLSFPCAAALAKCDHDPAGAGAFKSILYLGVPSVRRFRQHRRKRQARQYPCRAQQPTGSFPPQFSGFGRGGRDEAIDIVCVGGKSQNHHLRIPEDNSSECRHQAHGLRGCGLGIVFSPPSAWTRSPPIRHGCHSVAPRETVPDSDISFLKVNGTRLARSLATDHQP